MTTQHDSIARRRRRAHARIAAASAAAAFACHAGAQDGAAADKAELERLRNTTSALVKAMVAQGLMSKDKAEALLRQAGTAPAPAPVPVPAAVAVAVQEPAAQAPAVAAVPTTTTTPLKGAPTPSASPSLAQAPVPAPAASPPAGPTAVASAPAPKPANEKVVRVPYVSESLRAQIKEEIRNEVFAAAREEGWADSRQVPKWTKGIVVEGDVRVRAQREGFDEHNTPASVYRSQVDSPAWAPDLVNTQTDRSRMTLRARLGVTAKVTDDVSAGVRIATGGVTGPTSESQTFGTGFNRHAVGIDRAYLRWEPRQTFKLDAGRMAVPFFGTDLLWPDDLSLDGVALRSELDIRSGMYAFATLGAFPLEEFAVSKSDKWLYGAQAGLDWALGDKTQLRVGIGYYDFKRIEGVRETEPAPKGALAGTVPYQTSQYPASIRQKGNTLINLNDPTNAGAPVWGLASKFHPVNITAGMSFSQFDPVQLGVTFDYVKNSGFDLADIQRRAGSSALSDLAEKNKGLQLRFQIGSLKFGERGSWNSFFALRRFERDAWVDAFTDTTWHLGGTNYSGFSLGGNYAFDNNTSFGLRFTSTRNLDDKRRFLAVPGDPTSLSGNLSSAPLKIDVLQLELSTKF